MDRIDSHNTVSQLPSFTEPEANPGFFFEGNSDLGLNGTVVSAWWLNAVQEELLAVIAAAGLPFSKVNFNQLVTAIKELIGNHPQVVANSDLATQAFDIANIGVAKADTAQATGDGAQATADDAESKANSAHEIASFANGMASQANQTAFDAIGNYTVTNEEEDADLLFLTAIRFFITNPSSLHFPAGGFPKYFKVELDSDKTTFVQTSWTEGDPFAYIRTGSIGAENVATFGAWEKVAKDADLRAKAQELLDYINEKIAATLQYKGSFIGFYAGAPTGAGVEGNVQLKEDGAKKATYTSGAWVETAYSPEIFDLWANTTDGHGYYWFNSEWNLLDFNVDLSLYYTKVQSDGRFVALNGTDRLMTAVEGTKLAGIAAGAQVNPIAGTTSTTQAIGDTSAAGSASTWSKSDHKHGMPAFGTAATSLTSGGTGSVGTATTLSRSDHTHTLPTIPDISNLQTKLSGTSGQAVVYTATAGTLSGATIPTAGTTSTTQAIGDTSAAGSASTWSRSDHKHGMPAFGTAATSLTSGGTGSVGTAATLSRSDHTHTLPTIPDISGKQDKVPAGTAGVVLTQSGTAGTFSTKATDTTPTASSTNLITSGGVKTALDLKANLASPTFTGTPAAPTATAGTNTTQLATTAFVTAAAALKANLASPTFTGTPAGPTAATGTNTTQLATTAFVTSAVSTNDFLIDRIHWEPSVSEDPIKTLIPTGYSYAQILYIGTDGSAATLSLSKTYSTGSMDLSTTKTSISGFSGIGVTFTPTLTGGTQADFEIKYTKS